MRFSEYLDRATSLYPNQEAFVDGDLRIDFRTARDMMHRIANVLSGELGLPAGHKIAVYSPNSALSYLAVLGLNRADLVWLPINYRNTLETNIGLLTFFEADCLLFHSDFDESVAEIRERVPNIKTVVCIDESSSHGPSLPALMEAASPTHYNLPEDPYKLSIMIPTGGTTGPCKGAMHSHRSFDASILSLHELGVRENPRYLVVAPITHAAGLFLPAFYARGGASVILASFDAELVLKTIEREKISHVYLPPTAVYALLDSPHLKDYDLSSLEGFYTGAAPISPARFKQAVKAFGPGMTELYGQTEALALVLLKTSKDYLDADGNFRDDVVGSSGRVAKVCWLEIMDDNGNILGAGQKGEIVVRTPTVMMGYFNNPEATAEVSTFGWHHTTDVGIRDEYGYIHIVDRKKDMIISGGFNVFPVEIENILNAHPAVHNCAVVGVPDPKWGEVVKAIVHLNPGAQVDAQELLALCKKQLGSVKTPKSIEFWDALPVSPVGKVLKREIREKFWQGQTRAVN